MNAYPRLSERAYKDEAVHRQEVVQIATDVAADVWRYYVGRTLTDEEQKRLLAAVSQALPQREKT